MAQFAYVGETRPHLPPASLARDLAPDDVIELEADQVPDDGRSQPVPDPKPAKPSKGI